METLKSIVKLLLKSHRVTYPCVKRDNPMIILGNGPSLNDTMRDHAEILREADTMAVNFAANAPQFSELRPKYYILADPHFFDNPKDPNVARLLENLRRVEWPMTLFLPFEARKRCTLKSAGNLKVEYYNALGIEGTDWVTQWAYRTRRGMPRPRNVLIPAIMTAIGLGYKKIYLTGADHSWMKTLSVDDDNAVVSIQPHFYKEDAQEEARVKRDYLKYPLHTILYSFYVAFKSYHDIADYARRHGIEIYNATPGSFIDAFPRQSL